jgi:hypothetical protein
MAGQEHGNELRAARRTLEEIRIVVHQIPNFIGHSHANTVWVEDVLGSKLPVAIQGCSTWEVWLYAVSRLFFHSFDAPGLQPYHHGLLYE